MIPAWGGLRPASTLGLVRKRWGASRRPSTSRPYKRRSTVPEFLGKEKGGFFMYVQQSNSCNLPNSETPMTAARIARQDRFVAGVGKKFTDGNAAMADVISRLTPPVATGSCDDFTSSLSMSNLTPFPWPAPGPGAGGWAPGVAPVPANGATLGPADSLAQISGGWVWANPGGGSTYPWGPTQLAASRLIPPWACLGAGAPPAPGLAADNMSLDTATTWLKWLAIAAAAGLVLSATRRGRR